MVAYIYYVAAANYVILYYRGIKFLAYTILLLKQYPCDCSHMYIQMSWSMYINGYLLPTGPVLQWIQYFLENHSQQVVIEGQESCSIKVTSGVPQGTI